MKNIEIYLCDTTFLKLDRFFSLLETLPKSLQDKILELKQYKDRINRLIAYIFLKHKFQLSSAKMENCWYYNEFKKPYLRGYPFFNISHTNNFVIIAISFISEIGVDTESINTESDLELYPVWTNSEQNYLKRNKNSENFLLLWTRKEAVLKFLGAGFLKDPTTAETILPQTQYKIQSYKYHSQIISIASDYKYDINMKIIQQINSSGINFELTRSELDWKSLSIQI